MVFLMDRPVILESFWLRLHQPPQAHIQEEMATRKVEFWLGDRLVAQNNIVLLSDEWYLIRSSGGTIVGDKLVIQKGTDLDSLILSWGNQVPFQIAKQETIKRQHTFSYFQVREKTSEQIAEQMEKDPTKKQANYTIAHGDPHNAKK